MADRSCRDVIQQRLDPGLRSPAGELGVTGEADVVAPPAEQGEPVRYGDHARGTPLDECLLLELADHASDRLRRDLAGGDQVVGGPHTAEIEQRADYSCGRAAGEWACEVGAHVLLPV
jgi:hypothetical protein